MRDYIIMRDSSDDLMHWGIKGQKWGVRRYQNPDGTLTEAGKKRYYYQNPDGSLTEAGKKDYMTAARKGKLDLNKLSNADLDMINARFNREALYKRNISDYEKSKFSYKLKEAILARIKKQGGKKKENSFASLLAKPIKKAFEDAFKDDKSSPKPQEKNKPNQSSTLSEDDSAWRGMRTGRHFMQYGYRESDELRASREANGRRFFEDHAFGTGENRSAEDILRGRSRRTRARDTTQAPRTYGGLPSGGTYLNTDEYSIHSAIRSYEELRHLG